MTTTVIDKGWKKIQKELKLMNKSFVKVGILSSAGDYGFEGGKLSIANVGAIHEYGLPSKNIPQRPFMSMSFNNNKSKLGVAIARFTNEIYKGRSSTRGALNKLGVLHKGHIQKSFSQNLFASLSPKTLARRIKNSSTPLVDTGRLRQSIAFEVKIK